MISFVYSQLNKAKETPIGVALDVEKNCQQLCLVMYASRQIAMHLPPLIYTQTEEVEDCDLEALAASVTASRDALAQLAEGGMEEAFLLAQRPFDKVAIAAYTLYNHGEQKRNS